MKLFILCTIIPLGPVWEIQKKFRNTEDPLQEEVCKSHVRKMENESNYEVANPGKVEKSQFSLPSVKELAKQFAKGPAELNSWNHKSQTKLERKEKTQNTLKCKAQEKESEVDYSTVPISEIILHLQRAAEAPKTNHKDVTYHYPNAKTQMEICRRIDGQPMEPPEENDKNPEKIESVRFNGKEVHSLTARSISKEFREGLKNNLHQNNYPKINRLSLNGDVDTADVVSGEIETSPTPSIDLKNMKKFWEEIILTNSSSTKQK